MLKSNHLNVRADTFLMQRHLFSAMVIMTSIAVALQRLSRFSRQYNVPPEWALC